MPASGRKNEYHSRVSPMVRNGGRSNEIHIAAMKAKNTSRPVTVVVYARRSRFFQAAHAPTIHNSTAGMAKNMKCSQVIIPNLLYFMRLTTTVLRFLPPKTNIHTAPASIM